MRDSPDAFAFLRLGNSFVKIRTKKAFQLSIHPLSDLVIMLVRNYNNYNYLFREIYYFTAFKIVLDNKEARLRLSIHCTATMAARILCWPLDTLNYCRLLSINHKTIPLPTPLKQKVWGQLNFKYVSSSRPYLIGKVFTKEVNGKDINLC